MTSWLHEERLRAVHDAVTGSGGSRIVDLGCGDGDLFIRLAVQPGIRELVGVDLCAASLDRLRARLKDRETKARIDLRIGSMTEPAPDLAGFDCAVLVETIEHVDPGRLSQLESALFRSIRPGRIVITTPNAEFNPLLGVPRHRMRHPDHRFEWDRARFRGWCRRAAQASAYEVSFHDVGGCHPDLGGASQMAIFERAGATLSSRDCSAVPAS